MSDRNSWEDEEGSVTIEAAVAMATLIVVTGLIVGALATLASYIQAVDIAGAAARSHAIGQPFTPPRGTVDIAESDGWIHVTAHVPAVLGEMKAEATFPVEHSAPFGKEVRR